MTRSDTQSFVRGHNEASRKMKELHDDHKPLKKSGSSPQRDQETSPTPPAARRVSEEKRLEARRRSNRVSAAKARLRQKSTIRELQLGQASLRAENELLSFQLKQAVMQNIKLKSFMQNELQVALNRNQALQSLLENRSKQRPVQEHPPASPLAQLASVADSLAPAASSAGQNTTAEASHSSIMTSSPSEPTSHSPSIMTPSSSQSLINGSQVPMNHILIGKGKGLYSAGDALPASASPSLASSAIVDSDQARNSFANAQSTVPVDAQMNYLKMEIKALQRELNKS